MQSSIGYTRLGAVPLFLAITFALATGCGDSTGPAGTPTGALDRGSVHVSLTTTGADLDPDGFVVVVDSATRSSVGVNGTVTVNDVPAGTHVVRLEGIAANCKASHMVEQVSVGAGDGGSPSIAFSVACFTRSIPAALASTQLLFVRDGQIYRTRLDGTGLVALDSGYLPVWSPDGQRIAFARNNEIYVMDTDGAHVQRIARPQDTYVASVPTWSPDGRRLAFGSDDGWGGVEIAVLSLDGVTAPTVIPYGMAPAWSPDGSRIAFVGGDAGQAAVLTVAPDGSNVTVLTHHSQDGVAWSPDGKQIALSGPGGITVMNADGSGLRQITNIPSARLAWSPDGQAIAFVDPRDQCGTGCTPPVFYVTADGSTTGLLIENGSSPSWHQ